MILFLVILNTLRITNYYACRDLGKNTKMVEPIFFKQNKASLRHKQ